MGDSLGVEHPELGTLGPPSPPPPLPEETNPRDAPEIGAASFAGTCEACTTPVVSPENAVELLETAMTAGFADVLRQFRHKVVLDQFKKEQITRLPNEPQEFRNDLLSRSIRPVPQGLIWLHDDLGKVAGSMRLRPAEELTPEPFLQQLEGFQDDVELFLGQTGVARFAGCGEEFDPRRQTALRTIAAADPAEVGRGRTHLLTYTDEKGHGPEPSARAR